MVIGICDDNREDAIRIQQEVCKCLKLFGEDKEGKSDFFGSGNARVQWI